MKKVVVTGAGGFLGRYVCKEFSLNSKYVVGIGHGGWSSADWKSWGLNEWHPADITTNELLLYALGADIIVHCAGGSSVNFSMEHVRADFLRTVDTTSQVLEFIRLYSPKTRLVYVSSAAVYGSVNEPKLHEETRISPVSPYGTHKFMAEELVRLYARNFNLSASTVRLFSVYGPELRKQLLWDACRKMMDGRPTFLGNGTEVRDWLYVSDAASLITIIATQKAKIYNVFNGGTGSGVPVKEILEYLKSVLNTSHDIIFTRKERAGDPDRLIAEPKKAFALGWSPQLTWKEGVANYANWYLNEL